MDIKRFFMALPAVATMLLAASCSNQEIENIEATQASQKHSIPFEAVVNSPVQTRGTLNADGDAYEFQTGDRLFVVGGNANTTIKGELTLNPADAGKTTGARFTGTLDYTGDAPTDETGLSAWLKGVNDQLLPATVAELAAANGKVTFPATAIAASPAEAVEKYSYFFPMSMVTYGNPSFTLYQFSSFIDFNIALEDGTAVGDVLPVTITNGGSVVRTGSVTAADDGFGGVIARFTAAFMGSGVEQFAAATTLSSATVTLGSKDAISFGGTTELAQNMIYQVSKGYYEAGAKYTLTAETTFMGTLIHRELTDKTLPINTTTLGNLTNSTLAGMATSAVVKSGTNITLGAFAGASTTVSVTKSGTSVITVTAGDMTGDVTVTVTKQAATGHALTSAVVGEIIGSDGKAYAAADKDNLPSGVTAVAMVAYLGTASDCTNGLAIALEDVGSGMSWDASNSNNGGKTAAELCSAWNGSTSPKKVTDGTWRLPTIIDWQYMLIGCGATGEVEATPSKYMNYDGLTDYLTAAGASDLTSSYWSNTEINSDYVRTTNFINHTSGAYFTNGSKTGTSSVRACLAF